MWTNFLFSAQSLPFRKIWCSDPTPTDHYDKLRIAEKMKGCTNQHIFQTTNPRSVPYLFHEDIILRMFEKWWEIFYEGEAERVITFQCFDFFFLNQKNQY